MVHNESLVKWIKLWLNIMPNRCSQRQFKFNFKIISKTFLKIDFYSLINYEWWVIHFHDCKKWTWLIVTNTFRHSHSQMLIFIDSFKELSIKFNYRVSNFIQEKYGARNVTIGSWLSRAELRISGIFQWRTTKN